jgi:hypothetical protein
METIKDVALIAAIVFAIVAILLIGDLFFALQSGV